MVMNGKQPTLSVICCFWRNGVRGQLGVFLPLSRLFWSRGFPTVAAAVTCRLSTRAADVRPTSPDAPVAECFSSSVARSLVMPELILLRHWVAAI